MTKRKKASPIPPPMPPDDAFISFSEGFIYQGTPPSPKADEPEPLTPAETKKLAAERKLAQAVVAQRAAELETGRKARGLDIRQLATKSGIDRKTLQRIEQRDPTVTETTMDELRGYFRNHPPKPRP